MRQEIIKTMTQQRSAAIDAHSDDAAFCDFSLLLHEAQTNDYLLAVYKLHNNSYQLIRGLELWPQLKAQQSFSPAVLHELCHPHDRSFANSLKTAALNKASATPLQQLASLRLSFECRWLCGDGSFRRCLHHYRLAQTNADGSIMQLVLMVKPLSERCPPEPVLHWTLIDLQTRTLSTLWSKAFRKQFGKQIITNRQMEIMQLVAQGYKSECIAEMLFVSQNTINNHRRNVLRSINNNNFILAMNYLHELYLL